MQSTCVFVVSESILTEDKEDDQLSVSSHLLVSTHEDLIGGFDGQTSMVLLSLRGIYSRSHSLSE